MQNVCEGLGVLLGMRDLRRQSRHQRSFTHSRVAGF